MEGKTHKRKYALYIGLLSALEIMLGNAETFISHIIDVAAIVGSGGRGVGKRRKSERFPEIGKFDLENGCFPSGV